MQSKREKERGGTIMISKLIVKFFSYKVKARVYGNKSNLKNHPDKTFITEDLTKANHLTVKNTIEIEEELQNRQLLDHRRKGAG